MQTLNNRSAQQLPRFSMESTNQVFRPASATLAPQANTYRIGTQPVFCPDCHKNQPPPQQEEKGSILPLVLAGIGVFLLLKD